jgi:hypothetical protein
MERKERPNFVLQECIKIFRENSLTVEEILTVLSNLQYALGASIEKIDRDLTIDEVIDLYKTHTGSIGYAMMTQALDMNINWANEYRKLLKEGKEEKDVQV